MRDLHSLVLASVSPRRYELITSLGVIVRVVPSDVVEGDRPGYDPRALAAFHARAKADAVALREPRDVVIAADTVVDLDGRSLDKPLDDEAARATLRALSGREHVVHTAFAFRDPQGVRCDETHSTRVTFARLDDSIIDAYVATGEPHDKAGAYGIQARGAALVTGIVGDYHTVMGFPLGAFVRRLPELGYALPPANARTPLG